MFTKTLPSALQGVAVRPITYASGYSSINFLNDFDVDLCASSIIITSASTEFGDSDDDTHIFTGSLDILGRIS